MKQDALIFAAILALLETMVTVPSRNGRNAFIALHNGGEPVAVQFRACLEVGLDAKRAGFDRSNLRRL